MFKEKSSKKRISISENSKDNGTLDSRHQAILIDMQKSINERVILKNKEKHYIDELDKISKEIHRLHAADLSNSVEYENAWEKKLTRTNSLRDIRLKLKKTIDEKKELEYYENTGGILFDYYNLIENQEAVVCVSTEPPYIKSIRGRKKMHAPNQKSILEAFQMESRHKNTIDEIEEVSSSSVSKDKTALVDEYMLIMDSNYIKNPQTQVLGNCQKCNIELICILQEGMMICAECGYQELLLVEQNRPVYYRQTNKESCNQSYKRINHFNEWVSQIQGKETTEIPEEIFEKIVHEIKKEKMKDTRSLTYNKMREILKKLKFNKYYEHIYYIIYRLNGVAPPNFSAELEERLRSMFKEIQAPFLKHCPTKRKNFLSYSYVLFKFCQLLEKDEHLKHFSLLKSREKLHIQDQIWRNICEEVHWEFIQSI